MNDARGGRGAFFRLASLRCAVILPIAHVVAPVIDGNAPCARNDATLSPPLRFRVHHDMEAMMDPRHLPGNEPDPGDMAHDPAMPAPTDLPGEGGLPDDEADRIGDFA